MTQYISEDQSENLTKKYLAEHEVESKVWNMPVFYGTYDHFHLAFNAAIEDWIKSQDGEELPEPMLLGINGYYGYTEDQLLEVSAKYKANLSANNLEIARIRLAIAMKGGDEHSPTQWAYDQACKALNDKTEKLAQRDAVLRQAREALDSADLMLLTEFSLERETAIAAINELIGEK